MSPKICIIGDEDLISGLKIFGLDTFFVKDKIRETFKEILQKYSICFIQEDYFLQLKDLVLETKEKPYPLILPIPDHKEIKGWGRRLLRESTLRAIGAEILK